MEERETLGYSDIIGAQTRSVLRKCTHTAEEHIAMCTPSQTCPECHGDGQTFNGKYFEDCSCRTFCCKWLTETQVSIPWCVTHNRVGLVEETPYGPTSLVCGHPEAGSCSVSHSVAWRTAIVSGEK